MKPRSAAALLSQIDTSPGSDGCWPWTGYVNVHGYGTFEVEAPQPAHRLIYEIVIGPVPEGLVLDHTCHTFDTECVAGSQCAHRRCCNPTHLEPVTEAENKRRRGQRITRCIKGHPLIEPNLYHRKDRPGRSECLTCRRTNQRDRATRIRRDRTITREDAHA